VLSTYTSVVTCPDYPSVLWRQLKQAHSWQKVRVDILSNYDSFIHMYVAIAVFHQTTTFFIHMYVAIAVCQCHCFSLIYKTYLVPSTKVAFAINVGSGCSACIVSLEKKGLGFNPNPILAILQFSLLCDTCFSSHPHPLQAALWPLETSLWVWTWNA